MEVDLGCPKCNKPLVAVKDELICADPDCTYRRPVAKKIPSQAELMRINNDLISTITDKDKLIKKLLTENSKLLKRLETLEAWTSE